MSFIPSGTRQRLVPGYGNMNAKIAIVGDYTSMFDVRALKPFTGPNGTVLESCLHSAGLISAEVYVTNTFKSPTQRTGKAAGTDFFDEEKKKFTQLGLEHAEMLRTELNKHSANIIICCGNAALQAVSGFTSVAKYRGYICASSKLEKTRKLMPTFSPGSTLRGAHINRHLIVNDLRKAKVESYIPEIIRPERKLVYTYANVEEALQWLEYYEHQTEFVLDTEVINYELACISFATNPDVGCVIPLGPTFERPNGWTEDEEIMLMRAIQRVVGNPKSKKIIQNSSFDNHYMLTQCGLVIRGPIDDTMIGHSVMFPEFPKGLAFLGSLYCGGQEYWKDSVKFENIKEES